VQAIAKNFLRKKEIIDSGVKKEVGLTAKKGNKESNIIIIVSYAYQLNAMRNYSLSG
jgi:hypothetical protein